jgi:hypothetical protein
MQFPSRGKCRLLPGQTLYKVEPARFNAHHPHL